MHACLDELARAWTGWSPSESSPSPKRTANAPGRSAGVLSLLDAYPVEDASDDLVHATLTRESTVPRTNGSSRMNIQTKPEMSGQLSGRAMALPRSFCHRRHGPARGRGDLAGHESCPTEHEWSPSIMTTWVRPMKASPVMLPPTTDSARWSRHRKPAPRPLRLDDFACGPAQPADP